MDYCSRIRFKPPKDTERMTSMDTNSTKKFEEALQLLNEAAREKRDEIQGLLGDKYTHIRGVIEDATVKGRKNFRRVKQTAEDFLEEGADSLKEVAGDLDDKVHENPWGYIAGVAVGALLLGFIFGSSSRNK